MDPLPALRVGDCSAQELSLAPPAGVVHSTFDEGLRSRAPSAGETVQCEPDVPSSSGHPVRPVDIATIKKLALPIIPNRLYFTSLSHHPTSTPKHRFFTVDYDLAYEPYFADFGPLNIAMLVRFCRALRERLEASDPSSEIIFYSAHAPHLRANAGYLLAGFAVLVLRMEPDAVCALMSQAYPPLLPFRDASYGVANYQLTVPDVVHALAKAQALGWIHVDTFDVGEYEKFDQVVHGDWNWIVPGRFIAFSSPIDDVPGREAKHVIPAFRERGVSLVVRLNEKRYERRAFTEVGVRHEELAFPDGSTPPDSIVRKFLALCEQQKGAIAVHCKAGLGRTGSLISAYIMKHYGFSSREVIAWCRVCRPGSVIGPQQQYLDIMQRRLEAAGDAFRKGAAADEAAATCVTLTSSLSGRGGTVNNARCSTAASRPGTTLSGTRPGTRASARDLGLTSEAASLQAQAARAQSPAQRSRPRPLKIVESLPYEGPKAESLKRVLHLQALVSQGHAAHEAAAGSAVDAAQVPKSLRKTAVSSGGVTRPLFPPAPATFVVGVTSDTNRLSFQRTLCL